MVAVTFHSSDSLPDISSSWQAAQKGDCFSSPSKAFGSCFQEETVATPLGSSRIVTLNCAHLSSTTQWTLLENCFKSTHYQMLSPASFGSCAICLSTNDGVDFMDCMQLPRVPVHRAHNARTCYLPLKHEELIHLNGPQQQWQWYLLKISLNLHPRRSNLYFHVELPCSEEMTGQDLNLQRLFKVLPSFLYLFAEV